MWFDPLMIWLLRSPLHRLLSNSTMLVTYTGKRTGRTITLPVNYFREGNLLHTISFRRRSWWRNFRDGGQVELLLRGKRISAKVQSCEDPEQVAEVLVFAVERNPELGKYLGIHVYSDGEIDQEDVNNAAVDRVTIAFDISGS